MAREASKALRAWGSRVRARWRALPASWRQCLGILVCFALPLAGLPFAGVAPGERWEEITGLAASGALRQIVCAPGPAGRSTLYVVVDHWGVFLSEDGGLTWEAASRRLPRGPLGQVPAGQLALAPDNPQVLLLAIASRSPGAYPPLYKSGDGGRFWNPRREVGTQVVEALATSLRGAAYAASLDRLYRSTDAGDTWVPAGSRATASRVLAMAADPERSLLYLGTVADGLWRTSDYGATWSTDLGGRTVRTIVMAAAGRAYAGADDGLYQTSDHGATWRRLEAPDLPGPIDALAVRPGPPDQLFVVVAGRPVQYSLDGGATWQSLQRALLGAPVTALALDPQAPQYLYVGTDRGLWRCTLPAPAAGRAPQAKVNHGPG